MTALMIVIEIVKGASTTPKITTISLPEHDQGETEVKEDDVGHVVNSTPLPPSNDVPTIKYAALELFHECMKVEIAC